MTMSPITAFIMGFAFSFAWTPCVGPALTSVLLMAGSAESGAKGFLLIGVYTIGFILPFLLAGIFYCTAFRSFQKAYEDRPLYSENRRSTHGADGTAYVYRENE